MLVNHCLVAAAILLAAGTLAGCTVRYIEPPPPPPEYYDEPYYEEPAPVDYDMFVDLDFWGTWYYLDPYGWVWRPTVVMEWRPFMRGHWIWSDYGWMWLSYEPFGWATCHYGYWAYDFALGWVWIPGYEWFPHRVHWIVVDDYVCWAPAPAPGFRYDYPWYPHQVEIWVVVRKGQFTNPDVGRYQSKPRFKSQYFDNEVQYREPQPRNIERATGRMVRPVDVRLEKVKVRNHEVTRMALPESERRVVERYKPREEKKIENARDDDRYERERPRSGESQQPQRESRTKPSTPDRPRTKPADDSREKPRSKEARPAKKKTPSEPAKQQPDRDDKKKDRSKDDQQKKRGDKGRGR